MHALRHYQPHSTWLTVLLVSVFILGFGVFAHVAAPQPQVANNWHAAGEEPQRHTTLEFLK